MDIKELRELIDCAEGKIKRSPVVYAGCVESSVLLGKVFDRLGIKWERKFGQVTTIRGERIGHCWIETEDAVIETNPSQIWGLDRGAMAMDKEAWHELTKARQQFEDIFPLVEPTEAGHHLYNREAEQILMC